MLLPSQRLRHYHKAWRHQRCRFDYGGPLLKTYRFRCYRPLCTALHSLNDCEHRHCHHRRRRDCRDCWKPHGSALKDASP
jgi:hypothetical protein